MRGLTRLIRLDQPRRCGRSRGSTCLARNDLLGIENMPYQTPITVKNALDRIWKHDYVLPAIQREFVWNPNQICKLFDSLMQGFPVGSFLFWKIEPKTARNFRFFDFTREYHQRDNPHCPPLGKPPDGP